MVIYKMYDNKENKQIKELEELLETATSTSKTYIENDIKKLKYGHDILNILK